MAANGGRGPEFTGINCTNLLDQYTPSDSIGGITRATTTLINVALNLTMKLINMKLKICLIALISAINIKTVFATSNAAADTITGNTATAIGAESQPLSAAEVQQNKAIELRQYYEKR